MIEFNENERNLILAAIKVEKEKLLNYNSDEQTTGIFDEDLEDLKEIEREILCDQILLSRDQLDTLVLYLSVLQDNSDYDQLEIIELEDKINLLTDL
ncbi:hypothetical protein [Chryseobacterium sp. 8AT]|uniref:hypothetical protein n=1 Tax=Chryseobacterium sp. 8AT TaxID=2653134 RepID=UPI0012F46E0C|nr:hypothetical protein [Chryseobacterium sp. 8AT]VXB02069.1 conserved hypothetical protein [Chryseobacterium sp. 8AT]